MRLGWASLGRGVVIHLPLRAKVGALLLGTTRNQRHDRATRFTASKRRLGNARCARKMKIRRVYCHISAGAMLKSFAIACEIGRESGHESRSDRDRPWEKESIYAS